MPALSFTPPPNILINRNLPATNATAALQVVCAWPVSGQYGPGSRLLYYVLMAASIFAPKAEWLKGTSLAAALLFPAVAAIHGIVLAALHVDGAVDMDVYGAFQLCSIGILAAPVTVKLSRTYFYNPGRNIIFLWTGLLLAGLLSLTVEFFRLTTSDCTHDDTGNPVSPNAGEFSYATTCGLTCSVDQGPFSPMRGGSANNIYVIPAPDRLTFGTATLFAAACCIPAILSLVSMWNKILDINWKKRFGGGDDGDRIDEPIEGTNGATLGMMKGVNAFVRFLLDAVEIPVFGAAVLAILIIGERNFFSTQVRYQTEPIDSIGQWAPIVGAGLGVLGSLYLLLAADMKAVGDEAKPNAPMQEVGRGPSHPDGNLGDVANMQRSFSNGREESPSEILSTTSRSASRQGDRTNAPTVDAGNRYKVARALTAISTFLGTAAPDRLDDKFKKGKASEWPEIPAENLRNKKLPQIHSQYNLHRDADGNITPARRRAGSFVGSVASGVCVESPQSPQSRSPSPFPSPTTPRRSHANTLPVERPSFELQNPPAPSAGTTRGRARQRRDTLDVPSAVHYGHTRNNIFVSSISSTVTMPGGQSSPTIVVSSDPDTSSPAHPSSPVHPSTLPSTELLLPSEPLPMPARAALPPSS